ncbi:MAG: alpha/beta hydrolase-fold protein, partial [Bryobacterales bacterium]|nr:alpha/beta hydrolase-fold protein [Bryobacteraceae bacterium]MDW8131968.1 alpha/beta hydrolase-fold protein [Bryobacterales bacterium]
MRRVAFLLLAATGVAAAIQPWTPGPQVVTFLSDADDSDQPYGLYVPKNYDPARRYPLVLSLHGEGSNHRLNLRRVFGRGNLPGETDAEATRRFPPLPDVDFIVATPLARGTMGYQGLAEKDVYDVLADVRKRLSVDEDRIYLTGLSMGGGGALRLALTRPDVWAAVAAVCPAIPAGLERVAPNALNLAV